jgi:hypothetical protein
MFWKQFTSKEAERWRAINRGWIYILILFVINEMHNVYLVALIVWKVSKVHRNLILSCKVVQRQEKLLRAVHWFSHIKSLHSYRALCNRHFKTNIVSVYPNMTIYKTFKFQLRWWLIDSFEMKHTILNLLFVATSLTILLFLVNILSLIELRLKLSIWKRDNMTTID